MHYDSLLSEVKIGDYYLRLLLEEDDKVSKIHKPYEFFNDIYHRFLLTTTVQMRCMCLQVVPCVISPLLSIRNYSKLTNDIDWEMMMVLCA